MSYTVNIKAISEPKLQGFVDGDNSLPQDIITGYLSFFKNGLFVTTLFKFNSRSPSITLTA